MTSYATFNQFLSTAFVLEETSKEVTDFLLDNPAKDLPNNLKIKALSIMPKIAILAFSIELGIKALIEESSENEIRGHKLSELYKQISEIDKRFLVEYMNQHAQIGEVQLEEAINFSSELFVKIRYMHQYDIPVGEFPVSTLGYFASGLHERIKVLKSS